MIAGYRRVMVQFEQLFAFGDSFADASPVLRPSEIADHAAMAMRSPADRLMIRPELAVLVCLPHRRRDRC
jgi:hypothetical protein